MIRTLETAYWVSAVAHLAHGYLQQGSWKWCLELRSLVAFCSWLILPSMHSWKSQGHIPVCSLYYLFIDFLSRNLSNSFLTLLALSASMASYVSRFLKFTMPMQRIAHFWLTHYLHYLVKLRWTPLTLPLSK